MRSLVLVCAFCCLLPSAASADGIFTPFVGTSFGESDTEKVTTYGASLAAMAGGVFGFEFDFARTAQAAGDTVFVDDSRLTTVMGNLILGIPIKAVRPYAVGGLGWMRNEVSIGPLSANSDGLGSAVGGGVMGFFGEHIGVRFDLRYTRSLTADDPIGEFLGGQLGGGVIGGPSSGLFEDELDGLFFDDSLGFWRASIGVALRF